ncbi:MAG: FAD/NAD(P)-binding protein [Alphaproteobacteria bacterium]|nr:FAD/NAD(P)-binding protein [Alphaproteobacteria bacterium]
MNTNDNKNITIVGAGPNCTYALDILLRTLHGRTMQSSLTIKVFEASGEFGSGFTHSVDTPPSATLNRIAGQIALGPSKFYMPEVMENYPGYLDTFMDWAEKKYRDTGDKKYKFVQSDWPARNLLGEAMLDAFNFCVDALNGMAGVSVELVPEAVEDIRKDAASGRFEIVTNKNVHKNVDRALVITGASARSIHPDTWMGSLQNDCTQGDCVLVENPLPMQETLPQLLDHDKVFLIGTGTTAIDVMNYVDYVKAKRPECNTVIYPVSRNGLFCFSRAVNQKVDEDRDFHTGYVFTEQYVDKLRERSLRRFGTKKLDFEVDIIPVLIAEMAVKYYGTMFGSSFENHLAGMHRDKAAKHMDSDMRFSSSEEAQGYFANDILAAGEGMLENIGKCLDAGDVVNPDVRETFECYARTMCEGMPSSAFTQGDVTNAIGKINTLDGGRGYYANPRDNAFSWKKIAYPVDKAGVQNADEYRSRLLQFMKRDINQSAQGNVANPTKAACDSIWRDLRHIIVYAVEKGGVHTASFMKFLDYYLPLHNRIVDGPSMSGVQNIINLIDKGFVKTDYIFGSSFELDDSGTTLMIKGPFGSEKAGCVVLGSLDLFKRSYENNVLYKNMLKSGIVTMWEIDPDDKDSKLNKLGLALDESFHPLVSDGRVETGLTFLGPACEGYHFFQHTLSRPDKKQATIINLIHWVDELFDGLSPVLK